METLRPLENRRAESRFKAPVSVLVMFQVTADPDFISADNVEPPWGHVPALANPRSRRTAPAQLHQDAN